MLKNMHGKLHAAASPDNQRQGEGEDCCGDAPPNLDYQWLTLRCPAQQSGDESFFTCHSVRFMDDMRYDLRQRGNTPVLVKMAQADLTIG